MVMKENIKMQKAGLYHDRSTKIYRHYGKQTGTLDDDPLCSWILAHRPLFAVTDGEEKQMDRARIIRGVITMHCPWNSQGDIGLVGSVSGAAAMAVDALRLRLSIMWSCGPTQEVSCRQSLVSLFHFMVSMLSLSGI
jgi:hypothetical protein